MDISRWFVGAPGGLQEEEWAHEGPREDDVRFGRPVPLRPREVGAAAAAALQKHVSVRARSLPSVLRCEAHAQNFRTLCLFQLKSGACGFLTQVHNPWRAQGLWEARGRPQSQA